MTIILFINVFITRDTHEKLQGVVVAMGQYNCSPSSEPCHFWNSRPVRYQLIQESDENLIEQLSKFNYQY